MAWNKMVPFSLDGKSMLSWAGYEDENSTTIAWRPVYEFKDTLTIIDYFKGRSAINVRVKDSKGTTYDMFISHFMWIVLNLKIENAKVEGTWTFQKKGSNYGLKHI